MKKIDLRKYIIPVSVDNTNEFGELDKDYSTLDLIFIDSRSEYVRNKEGVFHFQATDYCLMNGGIREQWLRSTNSYPYIDTTDYGLVYSDEPTTSKYCIRPCLHLTIPEDETKFKIRSVNRSDSILYYVLEIGEYPENKVDEDLAKKLEKLYHGGNLKEGLSATGRWYSGNSQTRRFMNYAEKHNPEFEYEGNRYVRVISSAYDYNMNYSDGTRAGKIGTVQWVKVAPISFKIRNWDNLPKKINPEGSGKDNYFDLVSEKGIISGIPFLQNITEVDYKKSIWENSVLRGFLNGLQISIGNDFSNGCSFLDEAFNLSRETITEYEVPNTEMEIPDDAFNGCVSLRKLELPYGMNLVGKNAFRGLNFRYLYIKDSNGRIVLSKDEIKDDDYKRIDTFDKVMSSFYDIDYLPILSNIGKYAYDNSTIELLDLAEKLSKSKFKMPYSFAEQLIRNGLSRELIENGDFRFLRSEIPDINEKLLDFSDEERINFYKFAKTLGCFSKEKMLDSKGRKTEVIIGQKATSLLMQFLKNGNIKLGQFKELVSKMPFDVKPNQELLKFLSIKGKDGNFENLETLIELNSKYDGLFSGVMQNFDEVKSYRESSDEKGRPTLLSWSDCFKRFYIENIYVGVTKENRDIASLFAKKGMTQSDFEYASRLRNNAIEENIPEHILGKELKEDSILESIEKIKNKTAEELQDGKKIIDELYDKQFYYEWLNKRDAINGIIGIYCSCCASINNSGYGADIAKATISSPDVQNLVIRDVNGSIIAKGAMYVNRKYGYAVINDFELNRRYKHHEKSSEEKYEPGNYSGRYDVSEDSKEEEERELIFKAFQRGIRAFIEEYDSQNTDNPIRQVNVGMGYNRLKRQVDNLERDFEELEVPPEYRFWDATENEQYVLYRRDEKQKENSGDER